MSVGRWCAVVSCLCLASPAAAQIAPTPRPPVAGQGSGPDVVVNALLDRKKGSWKRAESEHVVIYS